MTPSLRLFALLAVTAILIPFSLSAQQYPSLFAIEARSNHESFSRPYRLVGTEAAYANHWDTLPQVRFWRRLIQLSPDSCLISRARDRKIISCIASSEWEGLTPAGQRQFLHEFRQTHQLNRSPLFVTVGKRDYYQLEAVLPDIHTAIGVFNNHKTDPWYAQAILLIESPGTLRESPVGARGPFQLMQYVARSQGLQVNKGLDERDDLTKSATAAAQYIRTTCLPEARRLMRYRRIRYQESDLWFRLLVLHVYHAGTQNVSDALDKSHIRRGGMSLIQKLWRTETADFRNASQNYSQVALATWLELQELAYRDYEIACVE